MYLFDIIKAFVLNPVMLFTFHIITLFVSSLVLSNRIAVSLDSQAVDFMVLFKGTLDDAIWPNCMAFMALVGLREILRIRFARTWEIRQSTDAQNPTTIVPNIELTRFPPASPNPALETHNSTTPPNNPVVPPNNPVVPPNNSDVPPNNPVVPPSPTVSEVRNQMDPAAYDSGQTFALILAITINWITILSLVLKKDPSFGTGKAKMNPSTM